MRTQQIPNEEWVRFFNEFSSERQGWPVRLEVLGRELGDQDEAALLPLVGVSADTKDGERNIEIVLGDGKQAHLTRIVSRVGQVWLRKSELEVEDALEIVSDDGIITLVSFPHVPPEMAERQLPPVEMKG
jgi:hypothetical protein